jgi:hypothetical protein
MQSIERRLKQLESCKPEVLLELLKCGIRGQRAFYLASLDISEMTRQMTEREWLLFRGEGIEVNGVLHQWDDITIEQLERMLDGEDPADVLA